MDQSQNKYSKWKKSDTKVQTLYDIQCNETLEKKKCPVYLQKAYPWLPEYSDRVRSTGEKTEAIISWSDGSAHYFDFSVDNLSEYICLKSLHAPLRWEREIVPH